MNDTVQFVLLVLAGWASLSIGTALWLGAAIRRNKESK